jgi:hypothetical protein
LGLELPVALGAIYQDLLTPEMKSNGYSIATDAADPLNKKFTISYNDMPVSACRINATRGERR